MTLVVCPLDIFEAISGGTVTSLTNSQAYHMANMLLSVSSNPHNDIMT